MWSHVCDRSTMLVNSVEFDMMELEYLLESDDLLHILQYVALYCGHNRAYCFWRKTRRRCIGGGLLRYHNPLTSLSPSIITLLFYVIYTLSWCRIHQQSASHSLPSETMVWFWRLGTSCPSSIPATVGKIVGTLDRLNFDLAVLVTRLPFSPRARRGQWSSLGMMSSSSGWMTLQFAP